MRAATWFDLAPGYLLLTEIGATGGIDYSVETSDEGFVSSAQADNPIIFKDSKAIIMRSYQIISNYATKTPFGWFTDEEGLRGLQRELDDMREAASLLNEIAVASGSERRVTVEIYPMPLAHSPQIATRIASLIVERLREVVKALRSGDDDVQRLRRATLNLWLLVPAGRNRDAVRAAVEMAKERRAELRKALRGGLSKDEAGAKLDLSLIEQTSALFDRPEVLRH